MPTIEGGVKFEPGKPIPKKVIDAIGGELHGLKIKTEDEEPKPKKK